MGGIDDNQSLWVVSGSQSRTVGAGEKEPASPLEVKMNDKVKELLQDLVALKNSQFPVESVLSFAERAEELLTTYEATGMLKHNEPTAEDTRLKKEEWEKQTGMIIRDDATLEDINKGLEAQARQTWDIAKQEGIQEGEARANKAHEEEMDNLKSTLETTTMAMELEHHNKINEIYKKIENTMFNQPVSYGGEFTLSLSSNPQESFKKWQALKEDRE